MPIVGTYERVGPAILRIVGARCGTLLFLSKKCHSFHNILLADVNTYICIIGDQGFGTGLP